MNKPKVLNNDGVKISNFIVDEKKKQQQNVNVEGTPKKLVLSKNAISFANPNASLNGGGAVKLVDNNNPVSVIKIGGATGKMIMNQNTSAPYPKPDAV